MPNDSMLLSVAATGDDGAPIVLQPTDVTWSSSNQAVVVVDGRGLVRAIGSGAAFIRARGSGAGDSVQLRVPSSVSGFLYYKSTPGDLVGQGITQRHDLPGDQWRSYADFDSSGGIKRIWLDMAGQNWWASLDLEAVAGDLLQPSRQYRNATRYPFQAATEPGMDFSANSSGCNSLSGEFTVKDIVAKSDSTVGYLHVTFSQQCDGMSAGLVGEVVVFASD